MLKVFFKAEVRLVKINGPIKIAYMQGNVVDSFKHRSFLWLFTP
jgi:hypothetical protein